MITTFKYELDDVEIKNYKKWAKKLPKISPTAFGAAGGGYWIKFIPTGLGTLVTCGRDDVPELDCNITNFDNF